MRAAAAVSAVPPVRRVLAVAGLALAATVATAVWPRAAAALDARELQSLERLAKAAAADDSVRMQFELEQVFAARRDRLERVYATRVTGLSSELPQPLGDVHGALVVGWFGLAVEDALDAPPGPARWAEPLLWLSYARPWLEAREPATYELLRRNLNTLRKGDQDWVLEHKLAPLRDEPRRLVLEVFRRPR